MQSLSGIIVTPTNEGAERWEAVDTVNLTKTERQLINDGVKHYIVIPQDLAEGARQCDRRWAELVKQFRGKEVR